MSEARDLVDAFEDLLDRERGFLLAGRLDDLARLAEAKAALVARLDADAGRAGLERLRRKAERNADLLAAAGSGVRSVTRRLAAVKDGPAPLSTYAADGRRTELGGAPRSVERRA